MKSGSRWSLVLVFLAAAAAGAGGYYLWWDGGRRLLVLRVERSFTSRDLPFLFAQENGLFESAWRIILLTGGKRGGEATSPDSRAPDSLQRTEIGPDLILGAPSWKVVEVLDRSPGEWAWFAGGFEIEEAEPLSVLYVKHSSGLKDLRSLEEGMASGSLTLAVPSESWAEEARELWGLNDAKSLAVLQPLTPERLMESSAQAAFGNAEALASCERDGRFLRLGSNLRAGRKGQAYWESANLVRRSLVEAHAKSLKDLAAALETAERHLSGLPAEERLELSRRYGIFIEEGQKIYLPAYLSMDEEIDGLVRPTAANDKRRVLVSGRLRFNPDLSCAGKPELDGTFTRKHEIPPFSSPKPRDVQSSPKHQD